MKYAAILLGALLGTACTPRVEVMVPVSDPRLKSQVYRVFDSALDPATRCFHLQPDATWRRMPAPGDWAGSVDHQERMASEHAGFRDR